MANRRRIGRWGLTAFVVFAMGCRSATIPVPAPPAGIDATELTRRGEYIVRTVAVCGHCHADDPKKATDGPLSGGMEFRNWRVGIARASNLTPDPDTGLGTWSDGEIVRALRNGVSKNGRLLIPVMPYEWFHRMSDADAFAVARYLKSAQPVQKRVTQSPNVFYRIGRLFLLRPKPAMTITAPPRGATAAYGEYLANHVGLCADCHTPRGGIRAAPIRTQLFAGMAKPPKGFPANPSNLTPDVETGIGSWTEAQFIAALRTGVTPTGHHLHPFMPWHENARMSDDDLSAIYRYLRTVPAIRNAIPRRSASPDVAGGE